MTTPPNPAKKRRPLLILLFVFVAGVGLFVWRSARDARAESFVMLDGSRIAFQAVTVGTNQSHCFGNVFQRMAARIPGRLGEIMHGGTVFRFPTGSPTDVILWFREREDSSLTNFSLGIPASGSSSPGRRRIKLKDDQGNGLHGGNCRSVGPFHSGDIVLFVFSTNVPPSSRTIHVQLESWRGSKDWRVNGEFVVPNPLYRKQP
jgi:hypothetical protein